MTRARFVVVFALLALAPVGCSQPDTVVLVVVEGTTPRPVFQLRTDVVVGAQTRAFRMPETPQPITLPVSFSVRIPRELPGTFRITIRAQDDMAGEIGRGTALFGDLEIGGQNEIHVALAPPPPAQPQM